MCDTTASCVPVTAGNEQNGDPGHADIGQDEARDVALVPSNKRKAGCLADTTDELSLAATVANYASKAP